jgi:uncharacterized protein YerC
MESKKEPADVVPMEDALLALRNKEEARSFLEAVLSKAEHQRLLKRWHVYQLRVEGMTLAGIVQVAGVAMATATRGAALCHSPTG